MSLQDPIGDMFVRIKNAQAMQKSQVAMPCSKLKVGISKVLLSEGYIRKFEVTTDKKPQLIITLKYYQKKPVIAFLKRVSLPSCRVYRGAKELPRTMGGLGTSIVSTSQQGVISGRIAHASQIGGEILGLVA
jgi:small subunit ribosomal protein S8